MPEAEDFDIFYATTSRRLVGQLFAMTGDLSEAEDAVQEAYIRAWRRWPRIRGYQDPEAWLRVVAYRISVNSWRKARHRLAAHHRADRDREQPGLSPDLLVVVNALRKIPEEQRRVIVLHHLAGLSVEEIAAETGAPAGTVKARLARGRRALAPLVSEFGDEPPHAAPPRHIAGIPAPGSPGSPAQPSPDIRHTGSSRKATARA
jgi:RNA polymerase sigma-70 factor (ECF subfamily)